MQATPLKSPVNQNHRVPYRQRLNTLQSEIYLTLQTRHAQALVRGRNVPGKPLIVGLVGFADRLRLIWTGAKQNDPYADWWLIKIEDAINATSNSLQIQPQGGFYQTRREFKRFELHRPQVKTRSDSNYVSRRLMHFEQRRRLHSSML